jgi:hypothetical protein
VQVWHDFFMTAGGASAALLGLLFVGVSIHLDEVVHRPDVRITARGAFQALIGVLTGSLMALIPRISDQAFGDALLGLGIAGILTTLWDGVHMLGSDPLLGIRRALRRLGIRVAGLSMFMVAGATFLSVGAGRALIWLMVAVFLLFASSAQAAWDLIVEVAQAKAAAGAEEPEVETPPMARPVGSLTREGP